MANLGDYRKESVTENLEFCPPDRSREKILSKTEITEITVENSERDENTRPLTCLLRNLYAGQEATVRTGHGPTDWFQIGKGVHQGCILSPCLFKFDAEYIMRNAGREEA